MKNKIAIIVYSIFLSSCIFLLDKIVSYTIITLRMATNVNMMKLRNEPGSVIDRVFYRNESFIVEKSGEERAAIVPVREYKEMQRRRQQAKDNFWIMTQEIQARFKDKDPDEVEQEIQRAINEVRAAKKHA
jgi:prevent-host-death family protein